MNCSAYQVSKAHRLQEPRGRHSRDKTEKEAVLLQSLHVTDRAQQRDHKNAVRFEVLPASLPFQSIPELELPRVDCLGLFSKMKIQKEGEAVLLKMYLCTVLFLKKHLCKYIFNAKSTS